MPIKMNNKDHEPDLDNNVLTEEKVKTKKPSMYKVVMLNDDYTPMDFVGFILKTVFKKTESEATYIMLQVHQKGAGVCGLYSFEVAETKAAQVMQYARKNEHPLQCRIEKD